MKRYLFVDAGCLQIVAKELGERFFENQPIPIEYSRLLGLNGPVEKLFYYDAFPSQERDEPIEKYEARTAEKRAFLDRLDTINRFSVFHGDIKREGTSKQRQKKVDIAIAVDMLTNAHRKNMEEAILLAGDLDFQPLLLALAQDGMPVTLYYPWKASKELLRAALIRRPLDLQTVWPLATNDFLEQYPVPVFAPVSPLYSSGGRIVKSWLTRAGFAASLRQYEDEFAVHVQGGSGNPDLLAKSKSRAAILEFARLQRPEYEVPKD